MSVLAANVDVHTFSIDKPSELFDCATRFSNTAIQASVKNDDGLTISLEELSVVWWRRTKLAKPSDDPYSRFIALESQELIDGISQKLLSTNFINHPISSLLASNKLNQLSAAVKIGIKIPNTLYTCSLEEVLKFKEENKKIVVKAISGGHGSSLLTQMVTSELLTKSESIASSPACYQEYIEGKKHLRIVIAGRHWDAVEIINENVDSRTRYMSESKKSSVPAEFINKLQQLLYSLKLKMGIIDVKVNKKEEYVFLEVNQQGQFFHLDAIAGTDCVGVVANCLLDEVYSSSK